MDRTERIKQILAEHLAVEASRLTPEVRLVEELGLDSFATVEIACDLEEMFDVTLTPSDLQAVKTFAELDAVIARLLDQAPSPAT